MSKPVQRAPPTPTGHAAETMMEWPLRVSVRARALRERSSLRQKRAELGQSSDARRAL